jgi:hypothetical protein
MAIFLAANLGELPIDRSLRDAMTLAHRSVLTIGPREQQALAWEIIAERPVIVEKYGGLNNASSYIAMMPSWKVGVVIPGKIACESRIRASPAAGSLEIAAP